MEYNSMQAHLLDMIQRAYEDELAFVSALNDEERAIVGSSNASRFSIPDSIRIANLKSKPAQ